MRYETNMSQRREHAGNPLHLFSFNPFPAKKYAHPDKENPSSTGDPSIAVLNIAVTLTIRITSSYPDFRPFQEIHRIITVVSQ
jgi:hypothetical protein